MTRIERELLEECRTIAAADGLRLADVLRDCHRFWTGGAGRALKPRGWTARAAAASRLLSRQITIDEHATAGIDATVEIDHFDRMTAEQLDAETIYLSDYQG
jgi:hypothetical protein